MIPPPPTSTLFPYTTLFRSVKPSLDCIGYRNGFGVCQSTVISAGAANNVRQRIQVGGREPHRLNGLPQLEQAILANVCQYNILLVGRTGFAETVFVCQVRNLLQLAIREVARRCAGSFQRERNDRVAGLLVFVHVVGKPAIEVTMLESLLTQGVSDILQSFIGRLGEVSLHTGNFLMR